MQKKRYTPEQIINKLQEAEILLSHGNTIGVIAKKIGVTEQTYYRWRREYGGIRVNQARHPKESEQENSRFKRVVADFVLDNALVSRLNRIRNWAASVPKGEIYISACIVL